MNKQANVYSAVMIGLIIFMVGMIVVNFIEPNVTQTRTDLSCSAAGISDGTKLMCLMADTAVPYYIVLIFAIVGGIIADKFLI